MRSIRRKDYFLAVVLIIYMLCGIMWACVCPANSTEPDTLLVSTGPYNDFTVECNDYEVDILNNCSYHLVCWIYEDNRKEIIFEGFYTQKVECAWLRMQR